ncbi:hypothetical protein EIZ39_24490 [Ammoniphilus sp. CFH 90114]|nr:hypothetical protein EIZ39_24490 [Ammoniphilus sp. CFH 90114]
MKKIFKQTDLICIVDTNSNIIYLNRQTSTILKVLDTGEPIVNEIQRIKVSNDFVVHAINSAFWLKLKSSLIGAIVVSKNIENRRDRNFVAWGDLYSIPVKDIQSLNIPCINIGVYGKDGHKLTERVYKSYSFQTVPKIVSHFTQTLL